MAPERFILNGRYLVDPTTNGIRDLENKEEVRLETRVMALLVLLTEQAGQLVSRETLVRTIWNDYGGADEALTQAVSILRKVLQDHSKTIIETIPKKGYLLRASVATPEVERPALEQKSRFERPKSWLLYSIGALALVGFALWHFFSKPADSQQVANLKTITTDVPFQQVSQPNPENYRNTVTTVAPDSTRYKLVVEGDRRPAFYINDRLLPPDEMEKHLDLIQQMQAELSKRRTR